MGRHYLYLWWDKYVYGPPYDVGRYCICLLQVLSTVLSKGYSGWDAKFFIGFLRGSSFMLHFPSLVLSILFGMHWSWANEYPDIVLPLDDCNIMVHTIGWLGSISGSLTTSLFLFRVVSVYHSSPPAKIYFICVWVLAAIGHMVFPLSLRSQPVQPDMLCVFGSIKEFGLPSVFIVGLFDWTAFWFISLRVLQAHTRETRWWGKAKIFITGAGTSAVPKVLLRTGHLYIL